MKSRFYWNFKFCLLWRLYLTVFYLTNCLATLWSIVICLPTIGAPQNLIFALKKKLIKLTVQNLVYILFYQFFQICIKICMKNCAISLAKNQTATKHHMWQPPEKLNFLTAIYIIPPIMEMIFCPMNELFLISYIGKSRSPPITETKPVP